MPGVHLVRTSEGYAVSFAAADTKTRWPLAFDLDPDLIPVFDAYVAKARPHLGGTVTDRLWCGTKGHALGIGGLSKIVFRRTTEWFGQAHGPHWFRKCLRSSAARYSPEAAMDAAEMLGHSPEVSVKCTPRPAPPRRCNGMGTASRACGSGHVCSPSASTRNVTARPVSRSGMVVLAESSEGRRDDDAGCDLQPLFLGPAEPRSAADQTRLCWSHAEAQGWQVVDVYEDRAISGASRFRPEFQRLAADAKARRFDVVLCEALDRLGRKLADVAEFHDQMTFLGIAVHSVQHGVITPMHIGLLGTMSQMFLGDLKAKTRRGLRAVAEDGRSAGGLCFGYRIDLGGAHTPPSAVTASSTRRRPQSYDGFFGTSPTASRPSGLRWP